MEGFSVHHDPESPLLGKQIWGGVYIRWESQEEKVWGGDRSNPHVAVLSSFRDSEWNGRPKLGPGSVEFFLVGVNRPFLESPLSGRAQLSYPCLFLSWSSEPHCRTLTFYREVTMGTLNEVGGPLRPVLQGTTPLLVYFQRWLFNFQSYSAV